MSTVTQCLFRSFRPNSPISAYRADMKDDVAELVKNGMTMEKAWVEVADSKLADILAERERIADDVQDAWTKTPAGKRAMESAGAIGKVALPEPTLKQLNTTKKHPVNGSSFTDAGQWLLDSIKNPVKKMFAARVLQALANVNGTVNFGTTSQESAQGEYNLRDQEITLSPRLIGNQTELENVLLHELVHAATMAGLRIDPALRKQIDSLVEKVKSWTKTAEGKAYIEAHPELVDVKGNIGALLNADEFAAEVFSDPPFQQMLKQIPSEGKKSVFSRFVEFIGKLFNALSAKELGTLAEAIDLTEKAMLSNWIANEVKGFDTEGVAFSTAKNVNPEVAEAAQTMIGDTRTKWKDVREAATGLAFRVRAIDNYAAVKKAIEKGDQTLAIQANYNFMMFAQRNHITQQSILVGAPLQSKSDHKGKAVYMVEAQEGPNLKRVSELLDKVEGYGTPQEVSSAFTLLAVAKRAQTDTWDRVFGDSKNDSAEVLAKKATARATADKLAKEYDDPEGKSPFKEAYREYQEFNKGMLQFAMQAGILKETEFRRLAGKQNYTPLFRADQHGNLVLQIDQGRDITIGRLADEPHMKQMLGGSGQIMDFFTASVRNASVIVDAALHNLASRQAAMSLEALGAAHPISESEKNENTIEFRNNGDLQRFAIDTSGTPAADISTELVVKGFAGVPASLPGIIRLMGVPAQVLRKAVTRNPLYMARQLVRDPLSAWLATGAKFEPVTATLKEVGKALAGTTDRRLDRMGLTGGSMFAEDETDIERIRAEARTGTNWWNFGYMMAKLDHAAMGADAVTRRNVFNAAVKDGASDIQAALATYESMPFSKRGTSPSVRYLSHMIPFLSASIQGWDVLYRAVKGDMPLADRVNIRNQLLARGAMIGAMSMAYALAVADDDDYKDANTQERLSNWFVRLPGLDQTIKVPIPFELGIIFKMIPEAVVRVLHSDKNFGDEARAIGDAMRNMAPNIVVPQAVMPLIEATLNRSFFTGNAIEGRALEGLDIGQRYDHKTSELSKALGFDFEAFGTQLGVSPKMLEYVMGQYTAGIYPAFAAIIDTMLPAPSREKPDRTLAEMPLFRSALLQENAGGEVNRLYEKIDKFTRASRTYEKLAKSDPERAQAYAQDNEEAIPKGKMAEKMKATLDKISTAENKVRNSDMSGAQKKEALDNFKRVKSNLATSFSASLS